MSGTLHRDDVEPADPVLTAMLNAVTGRGLTKVFFFLRGYGFFGRSVECGRPHLYLDKHEFISFFGNDVDFVMSRTVIPLEDAESDVVQIFRRTILSRLSAGFVVPLHLVSVPSLTWNDLLWISHNPWTLMASRCCLVP